MDTIIIIIVILFFREFYTISFDEEYSTITGIPGKLLYLLLLCLIALSVVILIRIVGIILVIALLTIPASICRQFTYDLKKMMIGSVITGIVITIAGLWVSYLLDIASGATIILLLAAVFFISYFVKKIIVFARQRSEKSNLSSK